MFDNYQDFSIDEEAKLFKRERLSIPVRNLTLIKDLLGIFDLRKEYPYYIDMI